MIFPRTRPPSEFQLTWSPTLNVLVMAWSDPCAWPSVDRSDRHPIAVELVILVIASLTGAKVRKVMDELNRRYPLHHLEPELILATQPQRRTMQHADRRSVHLIGKNGQLVAHVG